MERWNFEFNCSNLVPLIRIWTRDVEPTLAATHETAQSSEAELLGCENCRPALRRDATGSGPIHRLPHGGLLEPG